MKLERCVRAAYELGQPDGPGPSPPPPGRVEAWYLEPNRVRRSTIDASTLSNLNRNCLDMCSTCNYGGDMSKMIQLRNVPDSLHRKLKARAALEGMSLSDYLLGEIRRAAERPTVAELRERLHRRQPVNPSTSPAEAVRAERDAR